MNNLDIVRDKLVKANSYILMPYTHVDAPLPFPDFEKQDENGVGLGTYYSPNEMAKEMGNLLVLMPRLDYGREIDDGTGNMVPEGSTHFLMRYGMDWDTVAEFEAYIESIGLVNVRKNADGTYLKTQDIDYLSFVGNEFLAVPTHQAEYIPTNVAPAEPTPLVV